MAKICPFGCKIYLKSWLICFDSKAQCPVCLENISDVKDMKWCRLNCGHMICNKCITTIENNYSGTQHQYSILNQNNLLSSSSASDPIISSSSSSSSSLENNEEEINRPIIQILPQVIHNICETYNTQIFLYKFPFIKSLYFFTIYILIQFFLN